jgi:hypothetical protein
LATSDPHREVRISVIIPAYQEWDAVPRVLDALAPQVQRPDREAFLIDCSGDGRGGELEVRYPWLNVVELSEPTIPGRARNHGVGLCHGELIACLEPDVIPSQHWLDELERAMTDARDAVASTVLNAARWHPVGTAGYLLEFSEWLPGRRRTPGYGTTCSLLVRKRYLDEVGGFAEDLFPGEGTLLTYPLARRGRLGYAARASVVAINRTPLKEFLDQQVRLGVSFVTLCDRLDLPYSAVTTFWGMPFAPALRLGALSFALRRNPREALQALLFLPVIVLGLLWWTRGIGRARVAPRSDPGRI